MSVKKRRHAAAAPAIPAHGAPRPSVSARARPGAPATGSRTRAPRTGLRAVPTQERSRRRLQTILDAAATLFSDQGFEAVTVEAIAKSAGTPIGSVYQFFADKRAVFTALAERCNARTAEAFEVLARAALSEPRPPWPVMLEAVIDGFALLSQSDPNFRAINRNMAHSDLEAGALVHGDLVARSVDILARYAPRSSADVRLLVATTLVDAVTFTLVLGELRAPAERKRLLGETKTMLRLYVAHRLGVEGGA